MVLKPVLLHHYLSKKLEKVFLNPSINTFDTFGCNSMALFYRFSVSLARQSLCHWFLKLFMTYAGLRLLASF